MDKETLKNIAQTLKVLVKEQQAEVADVAQETEVTKLALMLESNQTIVEAIKANKTDFTELAKVVSEAVKEIKVEVPKVDIPEVKVSIPEIKIPNFPDFKPFPEVKLPKIEVPAPQVTVNVPEIKLPTINVPETVVNFPEKFDVGLDNITPKNPLPVINVDPKGNYVSPTIGGSGNRRVIIDNNSSNPVPISGTISATFSADFGSGEIGSQTLRTVQATNAISSVYVTGANGTIGVVTINPDGLPVYGGTSSGGGLTDTELRASAVPVTQVSGSSWSTQSTAYLAGSEVSTTNPMPIQPPAVGYLAVNHAATLGVNQLSGAAWSVSVNDIYGTVATNLVNPDGRLKVELPTGSSGLTDTELRASHLDVQQVSGATDSVNVVSTVGLTDTQLRTASVPVEQVSGSSWSTNVLSLPAVTVTSITNSAAVSILNGDGQTLDPRNRNWTITETVPVSAPNSLDVQQASGASWSINVLTIPAVTVTSITNSTASTLLNGDGTTRDTWGASQVGTWNVGTVTSITNTIAVANIDSTGAQYSGSNPFPMTVVTNATATVNVALTDSGGVQYSGSNPVPINAAQWAGVAPTSGLNETGAGTIRTVMMTDSIASVFVTGSFDSMATWMARTTLPTAKTDGSDVRPITDKYGRQITTPYSARDLVATAYVTFTTSAGYNTETTLRAVDTSFLDIIEVTGTNDSTVAAVFDLRSGTGNAGVTKRFVIPPNGSFQYTPPVPLPPQGEATALWTLKNAATGTDTTGTNVTFSALFVKS